MADYGNPVLDSILPNLNLDDDQKQVMADEYRKRFLQRSPQQITTDTFADAQGKTAAPSPDAIPLPNGGLTGDALAAYIKANPGPQATTGYNPANPGMPDEDEDAALPTGPTSGAKRSTASSSSSAPTKAPQSVQDLIKSIYGNDLGDDALKSAQSQRNNTTLLANLSKAGNQIGAAISKGAIKPQDDIQNDLLKQSGQGVQDILTRRDAKMKDMETGIKLSDLQDKESLRDPNSEVSKAAKELASSMGMSVDDGTSAESLFKLEPMIRAKISADAIAAQRQASRDLKLGSDQDKAKADLGNKITQLSSRGVYKNAMEAQRLSDQGLALLSDYPDLNSMPKEQVSTLIHEIGKIAGGGASTEAVHNGLMPSTFVSNFQSFMSKVKNEPTPAQAGAFLQQNLQYLKTMNEVNRKFVGQGINGLLTGYNRRVRPDDLEDIKNSEGISKYLQDAPQTDAGGQDPKISAWAKQNGWDYNKAAALLKSRGYGQ